MNPNDEQAHIYVLEEIEEATGPVKIGIHYGSPTAFGRAGLGSGNWRQLRVVYHHPLPAETVRWHEFVIHQHLAPFRVRPDREWFRVRPLLAAPLAWGDLVDRAFQCAVPHGHPVDRGTPEHQLRVVRMVRWRPPREIVAECSCGYSLNESRTTLPTVYRHFLGGHVASTSTH